MNYAVSISHEPQITYVMTSEAPAREIYVMSMRCQSSGTVSGAHVQWPTTVTPNAQSNFKSPTAYCSLRNEMGRNEMGICSLRNEHISFLAASNRNRKFPPKKPFRLVWNA